jgi:hypothetical protein
MGASLDMPVQRRETQVNDLQALVTSIFCVAANRSMLSTSRLSAEPRCLDHNVTFP